MLFSVVGCHVTHINEMIELNKFTQEHGVLRKLRLQSSRYLSIGLENRVLVCE